MEMRSIYMEAYIFEPSDVENITQQVQALNGIVLAIHHNYAI